MKRKFLEDLGLEKEVIDKIMAENGSDIESAKAEQKSKLETLEAENTQLKTQVTERDGQLETLKASTGDVEAMKNQIVALQADNQAVKEKYESDMKELKLATAIKLAVGDSAQDADLVTGLFNKEKLILSEDGTVTGLEDQLKELKKSKAFLFKEEKPGTVIKGGKPVEGKGTPPADKKTSEMTYSEMCAYLEANPEAKIE